eukprot:scaffold8251_cov77-Phaeocystis_antarctica.AAC.2
MLAVLTNLQSLGRVAQVPHVLPHALCMHCICTVTCLPHALHSTPTLQAIGFQGPTLGAKLASANRRDFTEEQLAAGMYTQTFLGAGSAQGAGERRG